MSQHTSHTTDQQIDDYLKGASRPFSFHTDELYQFIRQAQEGSLYPEQLAVNEMERVLQIGSGTGSWIFDLAKLHPHLHIYGIDENEKAYQQAIIRRNLSGLHQVELRNMSLASPLPIPDSYFDLICMRFRSLTIAPPKWPAFLADLKRLLRQDGWLLFVEAEYAEVNSPAFMKIQQVGIEALTRMKRAIDNNGATFGFAAHLPTMLAQAGFQEVNYDLHIIDLGFMGGRAGKRFLMRTLEQIATTRPMAISLGLLQASEFDLWTEQAKSEIATLDLCGWRTLISTYGRKPSDDEKLQQ